MTHTTATTLEARARELASEAMNAECPECPIYRAKLEKLFQQAINEGLEMAAQSCTVGPYFKATNTGKNLADAFAHGIRALKKETV